MADIKKFKFWAQKVLPAVYDDSLSYYEVLCKVVEYLNEVIDVCNSFDTDVSDLQSAVARLDTVTTETQTMVNALRDEMTAFNTRFAELEQNLEAQISAEIDAKTAQLTADITAEINRLNAEVSREIARLDAEVNSALEEVRTVVNSLDEHIDEELAVMRAEIRVELNSVQNVLDSYDEYIERQFMLLQKYIDDEFEILKHEIPEFENVMVVNPHTATLQNIQYVVDDLYGLDRSDAIDAQTFDKLGLTCEELDKYIVRYVPTGLTAIDWDYKSADIFSKIINRVPSIISGEMVLPIFNEMVLEKCVKQGGSYTANEWDNLGKDCDTLDELGISCYNIDWRSNTLVA